MFEGHSSIQAPQVVQESISFVTEKVFGPDVGRAFTFFDSVSQKVSSFSYDCFRV